MLLPKKSHVAMLIYPSVGITVHWYFPHRGVWWDVKSVVHTFFTEVIGKCKQCSDACWIVMDQWILIWLLYIVSWWCVKSALIHWYWMWLMSNNFTVLFIACLWNVHSVLMHSWHLRWLVNFYLTFLHTCWWNISSALIFTVIAGEYYQSSCH